MKSPALILALLAASVGPVTASSAPSNPVSRIVGLLESLSEKIEAEGKAEEQLFEDFVCWGKSVIGGKTASNDAAKVRIQELETVIADLDSGKTVLTSERVDLTSEIKTLNEEKEAATSQRAQEKADFDKAEEEMTLAIAALKDAIYTLGNATEGHETGSLLSVRQQVHQGMATGGLAALERRSAIVNKAVELGDRFLHRADATFLRRMLTGDVPEVSWKKLNRKATFRMSYKARSFKIQDTLKDMLKTFETNLEDARTTESTALGDYNKLMTAKGGQLDAAEDALEAMAEEKGAKALSRQEATDEKEDLEAQVSADEGFISQTQNDLSVKTGEWKTRKALRAGELEAISKTINVLHNDDARDLFKKSFTSQGYLFLQESAAARKSRLHKASAQLRELASVTKDQRIMALAPFSANESAVIAPAITAIDGLITKLKADEADDLAKKEKCETDRMADTRDAILKARLIDDKTDLITELTETIKELEATILDTETNMNETKAELAEATQNRNAENKEFASDLKDDQEAADTVVMAKGVLKDFYTKNNLMTSFVQQPVETVAGEAPTPPPETWEGAYMGATESATNIFALMDMVHEDIVKDMDKAKADEKEALDAFNKFKNMSETSIKADEDTISELTSTKGVKIGDKSTATTERGAAKDTLNGLLETIKTKASSGCDYFAVNYKLRRSNRQIELDGLTKAKAYLQGGDFSKVDPNREMTPGDAAVLMQKKLRR